MKEMTVTIRGLAPCIQHNGQMADPLNKYAKAMKAISGKRKKSDEDYAEMAKIEFEAGLYLNKEGHVIWPGINIERMLVDGAKKLKLGSTFKSCIMIVDDFEMEPRVKNSSKLFSTNAFYSVVKIGMAKISRCRPMFENWSLTFKLAYNDEVLNPSDIQQVIEIAGQQIGLGDWRPRYGRFVVESVK